MTNRLGALDTHWQEDLLGHDEYLDLHSMSDNTSAAPPSYSRATMEDSLLWGLDSNPMPQPKPEVLATAPLCAGSRPGAQQIPLGPCRLSSSPHSQSPCDIELDSTFMDFMGWGVDETRFILAASPSALGVA